MTTTHDTRIMQKAMGEIPPKRPRGYPDTWQWVLDETCGMWIWCENSMDLGPGVYKTDKRGFIRRTSGKAITHDRLTKPWPEGMISLRDKATGKTYDSRTQQEEHYREEGFYCAE